MQVHSVMIRKICSDPLSDPFYCIWKAEENPCLWSSSLSGNNRRNPGVIMPVCGSSIFSDAGKISLTSLCVYVFIITFNICKWMMKYIILYFQLTELSMRLIRYPDICFFFVFEYEPWFASCITENLIPAILNPIRIHNPNTPGICD